MHGFLTGLAVWLTLTAGCVEASLLRRASAPASLLDVGGRKQPVDASPPPVADSESSWDYEGQGKSWSGTCLTSTGQSPVNISTTSAALPKDEDKFYFRYPFYNLPITIVNDGKILYIDIPNSEGKHGGIHFGRSFPNQLRVTYDIYRIIVHTPSEHTFVGKRVPLELQLYHIEKGYTEADGKADPSKIAVVAVGFDESHLEASPFLMSLKDGGLPDQRGGETMGNRDYPGSLKFAELYLRKPGESTNAGFWEYYGSFTQPPCSSGVRWLVRNDVLIAKRDTLKYFAAAAKKPTGIPGNARALQAMGHRPVFPRFAENAAIFVMPDTSEPATFVDAVKRARGHQQSFRDALEVDQSGAKEAVAAGKSAKKAVFQNRGYQECLKEYGETLESLATAELRKKEECGKQEAAVNTLNGIAAGPARKEAAAKSAEAAQACNYETNRVKALTTQRDTEHQTCEELNEKVQIKAKEQAIKLANEKEENNEDAKSGEDETEEDSGKEENSEDTKKDSEDASEGSG